MALFWAADALATWVGLAMFGFRMNPAALFVGFATGRCSRAEPGRWLVWGAGRRRP